MYNENYMGLNGLLWFVGVVEDRNDPLKSGRVRVRILGSHSANRNILPTADLPWCSVMLPITASGISGIGQSAVGLLEGSWVVGYFRDGSLKQEPFIMGSLPGRPVELAEFKGFYDPNLIYPRYKDEPDVNRLAVNLKDAEGNEINPHLSLPLRRSTRITGVPTADFNTYTSAGGDIEIGSDGSTWNQPEISYNAIYPYNAVYESESGHLLEFDSTAAAQRIHLRHSTGTSIEMEPNGGRTDIIKADYNTLIKGISNTYVENDTNLTIDGHYKVYINKTGTTNNHYDIQVGPGANVNILVETGNINMVTTQGKINLNSGSDTNIKIGGSLTIDVAGNLIQNVEGSTTENTTGAVILRGSTIDLNP